MHDVPLTRELVLIGGGHAHALVLRRWGMDPLPGARLTLIDPGAVTAYTGMLPGFVAGHYPRDALDIDLVRLARFAGARLVRAAVVAIDREARAVVTDCGRRIAYDVASLDVGITSAMPDLPGFPKHAVAVKPLAAFADRWAAFRASEAPARVAVIGGGVGGSEIAMAMAHALRDRAPEVTVIDRGHVLGDMPRAARAVLRRRMTALGIVAVEGAEVRAVTRDAVQLTDGRTVPAAFVVGAAGARPWPWITATGLAQTRGFVDVGPTLQSSDPAILAVGDCAHLTAAPRPKAGVYAVRAAPILAHNLRAALSGGTMRRFDPQGDYLKLVSLGGRAAVATKWGRHVAGDWAWRWKDRIDRRFMDRLRALPAMAPPALPATVAAGVRDTLADGRPLCGGCGSKVGAGTLGRVLAGLPTLARDDVEPLPGDDAAVLRFGAARQVISTDHLRAFTLDPAMLSRIAAVHAMGDVWAMGGRPQAALASVILPRMAPAMQEAWLAEIMEAAARTFAEAGAAVVGGHTTLGAELTVGFTVTGLTGAAPITRSGARPGDALILTRPIGTGVILAAEMALAARGPDVARVLEAMARLQGDAAGRLARAHAMTDVTGFGLAGHLLGICDASGLGARIDLATVPVHDGALGLAASGLRSTLFAANRAAAARVTGPEGPAFDLLFDPQTAGGLLAALDPGDADAAVADLRAMGHAAARIGSVTDGAPRVTVV